MWRPSYEYYNDKDFLLEIDNLYVKEQHLKLTALTWNEENPIADIQGYATGGTINLNGSSAVRRSGSLTMVADKSNYQILNVNNIISINKKIAIEIGFTNTTDKYLNYDIIWIPLGVYIIKNANISHSTSGLNISLQISDKMCLLNGDVGGSLPAKVNFSEVDVLNINGEKEYTEYLLLEDIIRNMVNEYGGIQLGQIIINDIGRTTRGLMKWNGKQNLYKQTINNNISFHLTEPAGGKIESISPNTPVGYAIMDFVWPGKEALQGAVGDSVVTILEKISKALGNFEFYFDVFGTFFFQEIKNYQNTKINLETDLQNLDYLINRSKTKFVYEFTNANIVTSFQNTPQYENIKNDFIIWGEKELSGNTKIPIRYHLSINKKPIIENNENPILMEYYNGPYGKQLKSVEGRYKFLTNLPEKDKIEKREDFYYIVGSKIYSPKWNKNNSDWNFIEWTQESIRLVYIKPTDWRTKLYLEGLNNKDTSYYANRYAKELEVEWPKIYDIMKTRESDYNNLPCYSGGYRDNLNSNDYQYFLDFIEGNLGDTQIQDLSILNIGLRSKSINQNGINCIFAPYIPDLMIIETGKEDTDEKVDSAIKQGYKYSQVDSEIFKDITLSGGFNSAYEQVKNMLYTSTGYNENITISAIPVYYLEPNTMISVFDEESSIQGNYMIKTISLPLTSNGTMNLSCSKAIEKL